MVAEFGKFPALIATHFVLVLYTLFRQQELLLAVELLLDMRRIVHIEPELEDKRLAGQTAVVVEQNRIAANIPVASEQAAAAE